MPRSLRRRSATGLAARPRDRLRAMMRPGWARTMLVRRLAAMSLVVAAIALVVAGQRARADHEVVVAAHDLLPGHALSAADLTLRRIPGTALPAGTLTHLDDAVGVGTTGAILAGEIITEARLLSPRLPRALTGRDNARLVPVHLADDAVTALLRAGDIVDVLTPDARVLARRAVVAVPAGEPSSSLAARSTPRPVLLAMAEASAHRVAAAGLDAALAVVLH